MPRVAPGARAAGVHVQPHPRSRWSGSSDTRAPAAAGEWPLGEKGQQVVVGLLLVGLVGGEELLVELRYVLLGWFCGLGCSNGACFDRVLI